MPTYSAADIIGKNLVAKTKVNIYKGSDFYTPINYVNAGVTVGTVYSYLNSNAQRPYLIWMFKDANNNFYYAKHIPGQLKLDEFTEATSLEQQQQEAEEASQTTGDKVLSLVQKVAIGAALVYLAATFIKTKNKA